MLKRTLVGLLLTAAGFLVQSTARADVYRCVDAVGTTMFTDMPCPRGMRTTDMIPSAKNGANAEPAVDRGDTERMQAAIRDEERRRIEQDLAAREEALRRAEQELAMREQESQRRAEEDARVAALSSREDVVPVAPYYEAPVWYPMVIVPSRPCMGPRCFPHHPPHKPDGSHHDSHGDHHRAHGDGRSYAKRS